MRFGKPRPRKDICGDLSHDRRCHFPLTEKNCFVSYMMEEDAAPRQESNYRINPKTAKALEWYEKTKPFLRWWMSFACFRHSFGKLNSGRHFIKKLIRTSSIN